VQTQAGLRVVYDVAANQAWFGAANVTGHALVWELGGEPANAKLAVEVELDRNQPWLIRCDRVDFPPGGIAYLHTHPGGGIRCILKGSLAVETRGERNVYGRFDAWFETGADPVYAVASDSEETAFVRVMLLPAEWEGKRTIRYVNREDDAKPRLQVATIFFDQRITL
jgi:hypothetical protein